LFFDSQCRKLVLKCKTLSFNPTKLSCNCHVSRELNYEFYYLSLSYSIQHGTDYKIGLRLSVCQCVYLSVCEHSHGRISLSIFTKIGTDVRTPKRKNEFVRGQYRTTPSHILPHKTPILGQKVLKTHANIKSSYICHKCMRIAEIFVS